MSTIISEEALKEAVRDMGTLQQRNQALKTKLENMFRDLTSALDTPAGHAIQWSGQNVVVQPVDDMAKVIKLMSDVLNSIIGNGPNGRGYYYDKLFVEYDELDTTLKNKKTQ